MKKMSTGAKVALILGVLLLIGGIIWMAVTAMNGGFTETNPEQTTPNDAIIEEETFPQMEKYYKVYSMPGDANAAIDDPYLDLSLMEAGRLSDNENIQKALSNVGVSGDGYYFAMELTYDSTEAYNAVMPFAMLTGHVGDETHVANVSLYVANSDLTDVSVFDYDSVVPGCYYALIGYAEYDNMTDAQVHFYNSDYQISIVHVDDSDVVIEPFGYTPADNSALNQMEDVIDTTESATDVIGDAETEPNGGE